MDICYNFGRHLGSFIIMNPILNNFLSLESSILSMQTYLFMKTCLIEETLIKNKQLQATPWSKSFIIDQVFGGTRAKIVKYSKTIKNKLI